MELTNDHIREELSQLIADAVVMRNDAEREEIRAYYLGKTHALYELAAVLYLGLPDVHEAVAEKVEQIYTRRKGGVVVSSLIGPN